MADAVVSVLLEKLVTFLIDEGRQLLRLDDRFAEIRNDFEYMGNYLKDFERVKRRNRTETLQQIMNNVRELIYDVEEIIADYQLLSPNKKQGWVSSSCFSALSNSRRVLGRKLKNVSKKIEEVKQRMNTYPVPIPAHGRNEVGENIPLTYPILMNEERMVGLEDESKKIIDWLLTKNECLKVVGIVGMGGIGKTTLAQKIFKSKNIEDNFRHLIFVTVSQNFRLDELLRQMLKKLRIADELLRSKGVGDLLEDLKNKLDGEYLIVLDDVWGLDDKLGQWWESLSSALPNGKGCCVMVTTRIEEVARSMGAIDEHIHRAKILSDEDSWSLFCKVAFARTGGISPNVELEMHGKDIVAKCAGLPLTIKTVGGMMLGKGYSINEWERISKHLKEEMIDSKKGEVVISRLELSYEELPVHLRPCQLCCAMYPEDSDVVKKGIMGMWIAEGFVWGRRGKTALQIGEECLNELCNRFLILTVEDEYHGPFPTYKVHDAVREMLIKIATEENFFSAYHRGKHMASKRSSRLVIYDNNAQENIEYNNNCQLRTLALFDTKAIPPMFEATLQNFRRLRMLHMGLVRTTESAPFSKCLKGINLPHHLVYLHLRSVDALITLPDSIGNLRNLQWLKIIYCSNLKSLPSSISRLEKLSVLHVERCYSLERLSEVLGRISNLEQLLRVGVDSSRMSLSDLKQLKKLKQLQMDIYHQEECNVLQMPESLQAISLDFSEFSGIVEQIGRPLCHPLQHLQVLDLFSYPGDNWPAWLTPTSLPNLQYLSIRQGRFKKLGLEFFPNWKVKTLLVTWMERLEEDWANIERVMPSLERAYVQNTSLLDNFQEIFPPHCSRMTWKPYIIGGCFMEWIGERSSSSVAAELE